MTIEEMDEAFKTGYFLKASQNAPHYIDSERTEFLNQAQEELVRSIMTGNGTQDSFEETEEQKKNLSFLVKRSVNDDGTLKTALSANQVGVYDSNSFAYDLPSDFWLAIDEWVVTDDTCQTKKKVVPITHDQDLDNPFLKPNSEKLLRRDIDPVGQIQRHELLADAGYTITEYHVRYVIQPPAMSIEDSTDCILHPMFHRKIVNHAVAIALENSGQQRWQTKKIQDKEKS